MTDQEALEIVRARVAADQNLFVAYEWVWNQAAAAIRAWVPPSYSAERDRIVRNTQERARRIYMRELAVIDDPIPEQAARVAMNAVEAWNCPFTG